MTAPDRIAQASLATLIILQIVMLAALFAGVPPHPPETTPLFGIGPFIGAALACAVAALILGPTISASGRTLAIVAVIAALISFGPQKYLDPQFPLIWPSVIAGQLAALALIVSFILKSRQQTTD